MIVPFGPLTRIDGVPWKPSVEASLLTFAIVGVGGGARAIVVELGDVESDAAATERAKAGVNHVTLSSPWLR